jgi:hypothetical protein
MVMLESVLFAGGLRPLTEVTSFANIKISYENLKGGFGQSLLGEPAL